MVKRAKSNVFDDDSNCIPPIRSSGEDVGGTTQGLVANLPLAVNANNNSVLSHRVVSTSERNRCSLSLISSLGKRKQIPAQAERQHGSLDESSLIVRLERGTLSPIRRDKGRGVTGSSNSGYGSLIALTRKRPKIRGKRTVNLV